MLGKTKTKKSRLFEQVMEEMEEKSTNVDLIIDTWKNGIIAIQEPLWRVDECDYYIETIRQYELEQSGLKINKHGVIKYKEDFLVFYLEHKPSKWDYSLYMVKFSNGLIDTAATTSTKDTCSSSPLTLPYWHRPLNNVGDYGGLITQIYAQAQERIEKYFGENPKIKKGLYAELKEQMDHNGFGGLKWTEN